MGLALSVGLLADLKQNDTEGFADFSAHFSAVNKLLAARGLPGHTEPDDIAPWDAEMYGYSGMHYLRRLAAHVDSGLSLPEPGNENSSEDKRLEAYFDHVANRSPGFVKGLFGRRNKFRREFDHLIVHGDAEGFYLPQDFQSVLFDEDGLGIPGGMVGSTPRLMSECDRLARILEIPPQITKDSDELWGAADSQGQGDSIWQRYGVESFTCVALREACRVSLQTGAAIVFT
jgi:hypothetical protein